MPRHGRPRLAEVLGPAIGYADKGYPLLPKAADTIGVLAPLFREERTASGHTYLSNGAPPAPGARMRNPVLADTFRRIVRETEAAAPGRDRRLEAAI